MKHRNTKNIGDLGENIVCSSLNNKGYEIVERNYRKKYGEIDIIAQKENKLYFVEVKTVRGSQSGGGGFRPEENVHKRKLQKFSKAVETYLYEMRRMDEEWYFLVVAVYIDEGSKTVTVRYIQDVL